MCGYRCGCGYVSMCVCGCGCDWLWVWAGEALAAGMNVGLGVLCVRLVSTHVGVLAGKYRGFQDDVNI